MLIVVKTYKIKKYREIFKQGNVVRESFYINRTIWWLLFMVPIIVIDKEIE